MACVDTLIIPPQCKGHTPGQSIITPLMVYHPVPTGQGQLLTLASLPCGYPHLHADLHPGACDPHSRDHRAM